MKILKHMLKEILMAFGAVFVLAGLLVFVIFPPFNIPFLLFCLYTDAKKEVG